ncbi:putative periodic tryptophan 1-like protein [Gregarina niphandrodes]|uniref:Periodic tryptophan 1-like protein n=1 Tax=Gregarina niphandrodes TaxID=110365 RepID=A0A023B7E9_GRENI|nr:putative periodic tryptophan 1-like protein [Gregarina niphandrodes]EZG67243.1 putative periodic tryptophan 1-like protein [Gregarina niphandrodes]|eukprot:XP_011130288.1 putative periodic tryptophan 1-like protein [Gregarina niphandrodes]
MEEEAVSIKTCVLWIPRGVAAEKPSVVDVAEDQLTTAGAGKRADRASVEIASDGASQDQDQSQAASAACQDAFEKEFRMDGYDREEADGSNWFSTTKKDLELMAKADPYLDPKELAAMEAENAVDLRIDAKKDLPLVLGSVEGGDDCTVETYLYDEEAAESYTHHAIVMQAFPLCMEYLPIFGHKRRRQYIAVGTFLPVIEIYNNDRINQLEPDFVLDTKDCHHDEAVSALQVNPKQPHILLSLSHDRSAILWDLATKQPLKKLSALAEDKINCGQWHPEGHVFACGSEDETIRIVHAASGRSSAVQVGEVVESLTWLRGQPNLLVAGASDGSLFAYHVDDQAARKVWETTVSDSPVLCVADCLIPGLLLCGCEDGAACVYDTRTLPFTKVATKDMQAGPLYHAQASPDVPSLVAFAATDSVIWDLLYEQPVRTAFGLAEPNSDEAPTQTP